MMNCVELANAILTGEVEKKQYSKPLLDDALYNNVMVAVTALSKLFDTDEERSFDVEITRNGNAVNVEVCFNTYYFQFTQISGLVFDSVFANAKRLVVTTVDDDNLVNVKLIY